MNIEIEFIHQASLCDCDISAVENSFLWSTAHVAWGVGADADPIAFSPILACSVVQSKYAVLAAQVCWKRGSERYGAGSRDLLSRSTVQIQEPSTLEAGLGFIGDIVANLDGDVPAVDRAFVPHWDGLPHKFVTN